MDDLIAELLLKDGTQLTIRRLEDKTMVICREDSCLTLPTGSANQFMEFLALLEPMIASIKTEEENNVL